MNDQRCYFLIESVTDDSRCVSGGLYLRSGLFHILPAETEPRKQTHPHSEARFHPVRETLSVLRAQTDQTTGCRSEPTTQSSWLFIYTHFAIIEACIVACSTEFDSQDAIVLI